MIDVDHCHECRRVIDPTKRLYAGPGGTPRCAVCQCLAELRLELVRVTTLAQLMEEMDGKGPVQ